MPSKSRKPADASAQGSSGARGGLAQPVKPDPVLAEVVGAEAPPRAELTRRIWNYIRQHDLQDASDRRMIRADDRLRRGFDGKDRVSMFELGRLVNRHVESA